jgi:methylmalonyl-CoA/ethylmalonyl-CoA epimerase
MRRILSVVVQALIVMGAVTQAAGLADKAESKRPLATAHPYLMSLSVADLDLSVRWYCEMLGFRETRRLNLPDSSLRISFLELNGFRLELVEFKNSVSLAAIQSKFPIVDDRAKVQGFGKLAFAVTSVRDVAASLKRVYTFAEKDKAPHVTATFEQGGDICPFERHRDEGSLSGTHLHGETLWLFELALVLVRLDQLPISA